MDAADKVSCSIKQGETEANARAKMLIYLLENALMEVPSA